MGTVRLRPAESVADADAVGDVFLAARAGMTYLPRVHTDDETRAHFRRSVLSGSEVTVAEQAGRVVGFVALRDDWVQHLYVQPEEQSRGAGTALLALAKERRPGGLRLWVFQKNAAARRFYERHGFSLVQLTDGRDNEERVPDALYVWRGGG